MQDIKLTLQRYNSIYEEFQGPDVLRLFELSKWQLAKQMCKASDFLSDIIFTSSEISPCLASAGSQTLFYCLTQVQFKSSLPLPYVSGIGYGGSSQSWLQYNHVRVEETSDAKSLLIMDSWGKTWE